MASELQIEANRRNAQHAVVQTEQEAEFQEIQQSFEDHYQPVGPVETLLVQQVVMAAWRLGRLRGMETGLFNRLLNEEKGDLRRLKNPTRHDHRAHNELQRLQAARPQSPPKRARRNKPNFRTTSPRQ